MTDLQWTRISGYHVLDSWGRTQRGFLELEYRHEDANWYDLHDGLRVVAQESQDVPEENEYNGNFLERQPYPRSLTAIVIVSETESIFVPDDATACLNAGMTIQRLALDEQQGPPFNLKE